MDITVILRGPKPKSNMLKPLNDNWLRKDSVPKPKSSAPKLKSSAPNVWELIRDLHLPLSESGGLF